MWGLSALAHSTEALPGTVQASLHLVNVAVMVRILVRVWPHFSLSGRKCGQLTREDSCCSSGSLKNMISLTWPLASFFARGNVQRPRLVNDSGPGDLCVYVVDLNDVSFHSFLTDVCAVSHGL